MEKRHIPSLKLDHNVGDKSKFSFYMSNYLYYANAEMTLCDAHHFHPNRKIFANTYELHYDYMATHHRGAFRFGFVRAT